MRKSKVLMSLVLATTISLGSFGFVNAEVQSERLKGNNRYETAKEIALKFEKSEYAILVNGENYPDALASTPLAKKYNAPILLTNKYSMPIQTKEVINKLGVKNVIIIGGEGAISKEIEDDLVNENKNVERIYGANRYDTSMKIAEKVGLDKGVFLTTGSGFADALGVGSIAANKDMPVILTPSNDLPKGIENKIKSVPKTYIIGGTGAISSTIENKLSNVERIQGNNRYETNENLIEKFKDELDMSNVFLTSGTNFPDALAGSSLAAKTNSPIILANPKPTKTTKKMTSNAEKMFVLGGEGAVSAVLEDMFKGHKIEEMKVTYLNVGQGDCILVQNGEHNMLIDAGSNATEDKVKTFLDSKGIKKFDIVVASVIDEGHIGGMDNILRNYKVDKFYKTPFKIVGMKDGIYHDMMEELYNKNVEDIAVVGKNVMEREELYLGNAKIDTIYAQWENEANNDSIMLRISHGDNKYLFTGNVSESAEENMCDLSDKYLDLHANVLKVANYGKNTSSSQKMLNKINPDYAVISSEEEPDQQVIDKLNKRNVEVHKTNKEGNVVSLSDGQFIEFTTED